VSSLEQGLELDVAVDAGQTLADAIAAVIGQEPGVSATVLDPNGPGGGWPLVRFDGPVDALARIGQRYEGEAGS
jgi:hypothetical protein